MVRKYVSDIIGEEYKQWHPGERVLISTATGSGKTQFILCVLVRHAKAMGKHLVYYCNRKFLNMQVQSAARRLLLNELGEDEEGLAAHLYIRTYQHTERVKDYPHVKAVDESGAVIQGKWEVREEDVLYYVYDEAFYFVADAAFNAQTHYWYESARITERKKSVSVFLAATPKPLQLFLSYVMMGETELEKLCGEFIARNAILEGRNMQRWMYYLYEEYRYWSKQVKQLQTGYDYQMWSEAISNLSEVEKEIVADCENPHRNLFRMVEQAYCLKNRAFSHIYEDSRTPSERYDYLDVHYFANLEKLAEVIASSVKENTVPQERWLVFVRKKADGDALQASLRTLHCDSVMVTAAYTKNYNPKPPKRRGAKRKVFDALVNEERLTCNVLISTSVLDCGVSLQASSVSNLVICQPEQTSFLQMLGRIRVTDGQRVNLYIQSFTPDQIKGHKNKILSQFRYLVQLSQINRKTTASSFANVPEPGQNGMIDFYKGETPFLPRGYQERLLKQLDKDTQKNHTYKDQKGTIQANKLAILYYLEQAYYMEDVLPEYNHDPCYFLKEQLSWIGRGYDPACWFGAMETIGAISGYVGEMADNGVVMDKNTQNEFRRNCFFLFDELCSPPVAFQRARQQRVDDSAYYPGKKLLSDLFCECGIPYQIVAKPANRLGVEIKKQLRCASSSMTYWMVVPADPDTIRTEKEQRNHVRHRRKDNLISQNEPVAEYVQSPKKQLKVCISYGEK